MSNRRSYRTEKRARMLAKMAAMRVAKARKRMASQPPEWVPRKVPAGELLGILQWHSACGDVHRITVRQGARANQIRVPGCRRDHGFDWLFRKFQAKLAGPRRIISAPPEQVES